jgi:uncharacterized lipoprotein YmbA
MKKLIIGAALLLLAGCSSSTSQYYEAVEKAAAANAAASQAKFEALSKIAAAGDGQAASAAVMALALTQTPTVQPIPQQSAALQWASVLAAPLSNMGMMWMQTDSTKTMAQYNRDVDLARITADATTQQALYGSFTAQSSLTSDVALGALNAMGNVDYTPFVDGMVTLGTSGMNGLVDVSNAGLDSAVAISNAGFESTASISNAGMNGIVDMGNAGINGVVDVSNTGMNSIITMDQSNADLIKALMEQYTSTVNGFIENPLTNTSTQEVQTITCSASDDGTTTTVTCD